MKHHVSHDHIACGKLGRADVSSWCRSTTPAIRNNLVLTSSRPPSRQVDISAIKPISVPAKPHDPTSVVMPYVAIERKLTDGEAADACLAGSDAYWALLAQHGVKR